LEALMQLAPGAEWCVSVPSIVSTLELKEAVGAIVDSLPPEDKYIIEQLLVQGNSLRKLGYVLGIPKTSLARRRDKIRKQLMVELAAHPGIQNWIRT
jgi:DNA-directed RNA polymerase specialized sigma24 family protein